MTAGFDLGVEVEKERGGLGQKEIGKGNWGLRGLLSPHPFLLYLLFFLLLLFLISQLRLCANSLRRMPSIPLCAATHGGSVVIHYTGCGFRSREYCQRFSSCWEILASWRYRGGALGAVHEPSWG